MQTLAYRNRKTFLERFGPEQTVGEALHPIYDYLHDQKIYVRGKYQSYKNVHFDNQTQRLKRYSTDLSEFYADQCQRAISAMVKPFR